MNDSVKTLIVARLLAIAAGLKTSDFGFRVVERRFTPFLTEPQKPALHLITFPEDVIEQVDRGYTVEFHVMFKLMIEDPRDPYALADRAVAFLQQAIESDGANPMQLGGLVSALEYVGDQPFTDELLKPAGGTTVNYMLRYRRFRGGPTTSF